MCQFDIEWSFFVRLDFILARNPKYQGFHRKAFRRSVRPDDDDGCLEADSAFLLGMMNFPLDLASGLALPSATSETCD